MTALCAKPTRQGILYLPSDSSAWQARLFVLSRPYLLVYPAGGANADEPGISLAIFIGAGGVRVEAVDTVMEDALLGGSEGERGVTLALYTASNSYMLRAKSRVERDEWIGAIGGGVGGNRR